MNTEARFSRNACIHYKLLGNIPENSYHGFMNGKEEIIERIISTVNRTAPDSEVWLYGSRARGRAGRFSDWDILILLKSGKLTYDFETKVMDDLYEIELDTGEIISPLIYTKKDWYGNRTSTPLYENIQREGVRIK